MIRKIGLIILCLLIPGQVLAITPEDLQSLENNTFYFWGSETSDSCIATTPTGTDSAPSTQDQNQIAETIIGIAKTDNIGEGGALDGLVAALQESELTNLSNADIPVSLSAPGSQGDDGGYADNYDSVGIFQQRVASGWSTLAPAADATIEESQQLSQVYANGYPQAIDQIMTPAYAAEAFLGNLGTNVPSALNKGLQNYPDWQSLEPGVAAVAVGDPGAVNDTSVTSVYQAHLSHAQKLLNQLWNSSPPVALPVPINGPSTTAPGTTPTGENGTCGTTTTGNAPTQAVIEAGLAEIAKNIPYSFGGGGINGPSVGICDPERCPNDVSGFDCASFMQYIFYQGAKILLPAGATAQYNATVGAGHSVQLSAIQPGDLMFFGALGANGSPPYIEHVNMYVGNNEIIEAPETGENLHEIPMYTVAGPGETLQGIGSYPPIGD